MNKNTRVRHATRGFVMKFGDVENGIAGCALAWVVRGQTFRDLTEEEAIDARNRMAGMREAFPPAELPGIVIEGIADIRHERAVAWQGTQFAIAGH